MNDPNMTFNVTVDGIYEHPIFTKFHEENGSGWYDFSERLGLGGIFRLTSRGVIPFNPKDDRPIRIHDAYDILRAIDEGRCDKLIMERRAKEEVCFTVLTPNLDGMKLTNELRRHLLNGYVYGNLQ